MVPLGTAQLFTVQLILAGMAVGLLHYFIFKRAFKLLFHSLVGITISALSSIVPYPVSYILFILGHVALGMFIVAVVLVMLIIFRMVAAEVPLVDRL